VDYRKDLAVEVDVGVQNLTNASCRDFLDPDNGYALSPGRNLCVKASVPFGSG